MPEVNEGSLPSPPGRLPKQAVVVIHGMGEQIPMDTLRGFIRNVWKGDKELTRNGLPNPEQVWSKPDTRAGSHELRRITTRQTRPLPDHDSGVRTDFYELYWADLTAGSKWDEFTSWVAHLLFRRWSRVPKDVREAYVLLLVSSIVIAVVAALALVPGEIWKGRTLGGVGLDGLATWNWVILLAAGAGGSLLHSGVTKTFGRVVRYTVAKPDHIATRQAVRERGLLLLSALHEGGSYERIIIVSHSLGTILALDLLSYFWAQREAAHTIVADDEEELGALVALEVAAAKLCDSKGRTPADIQGFHRAQRRLRKMLAGRQAPSEGEVDRRWLISDFVTLGSPLTHAEFLLAESKEDLTERFDDREMMKCPPEREQLDPAVQKWAARIFVNSDGQALDRLFSFPTVAGDRVTWELHHAAAFSVVRWVNVYDPPKGIFWGDLIGGPLSDTFGPGVTDVSLRQQQFFTHTKYWSRAADSSPSQTLRLVVNLSDEERIPLEVPLPAVITDVQRRPRP